MKHRFLFILMIFLAGCVSVTIQYPTPDAPAQAPGVTALPSPTVAPSPAAPTPLPPTPDLTAQPVEGPARSLYMLAQSAVWVLRPGAAQPERLTPADSVVTAFDVGPDDGRLAYGTKSGKLYVILPKEQPRLLVKLQSGTPYAPFITGLDWSPDGSRLAFTVDYESGGQTVLTAYPSRPSGVWVTPIKDGQPAWLMSNRYLADFKDDVNAIRHLDAPGWSPDGGALMVQGLYWEWTNRHWLDPLQYAEDDRNLHTLPGGSSWASAAWMPDGQGLLLSGQANVSFGDLVWASRDGQRTEKWIDGTLANLYIYDASPVPTDSYLPGVTAGIHAGPGRIIFLASCPPCQNSPAARLFVQVQTSTGLQGQAVGPERLCTRSDRYGNANTPRHIEWRPDYSAGVLTCGANEIYLLNLRSADAIQTDLMPALGPVVGEDVPVFRWGERE